MSIGLMTKSTFLQLTSLTFIALHLTACFSQGEAKSADSVEEGPVTLTGEQEKLFLDAGGDELLADARSQREDGFGPGNIEHCLAPLARDRLREKEGADYMARIPDVMSCVQVCPKEGPLAKYQQECISRRDSLGTGNDATLVKIAVDKMKAADNKLDMALWDRSARIGFENIGDAQSPQVDAVRKEYDEVVAANQADLEKGRAFLARPDIQSLAENIAIAERKLLTFRDWNAEDADEVYVKAQEEAAAHARMLREEILLRAKQEGLM